jgi:hypothetical protein
MHAVPRFGDHHHDGAAAFPPIPFSFGIALCPAVRSSSGVLSARWRLEWERAGRCGGCGGRR